MSFNLPSFPYPPSREGYWNPVTSTLNWCEEDYYATEYCAEIVNTLTNLIFVFLAFKGLHSCVKYGHDRVFFVAFLTYLFIGLGSICFHTSLKYPMQLLDELSMIYTTCTTFFAVFSFGRSFAVQILVFIFAVALAAFITGYYHYLGDPTFHQNVFALITAIVVLTSMYKMERLLRPSLRPKNSAISAKEQSRVDKRDLQILHRMWFMVGCGLGSVGFGFFLWNLDNIFCTTLRQWRREVGLPWGIFLEFHGWWHIFTGLAAYYNLTWGVWLRYCLKGMQDDVEVIWPSLYTSMPVVVRKDKSKIRVSGKTRQKKLK